MKRCFIIVNLFCLSLLTYADTSLHVEYNQAMQEYKERDFASSYKKFSKLYLTNLSDAKLNFYLGRSAYETGHYEVALAAFERVEMLEPTNLRNRLEMARTYFMLKMYEDAQNSFKAVLENPNIPQNVRTNIELYLAKVTKVQKKSFTYARVNLDVMYDSNVNYGSLDSEFNINTGTLPSEPELSDGAGVLYGDIVNIYDIGDKNGFAIKNRLSGYIKNYFKENDYDVGYFAYTPSLLYTQTASLMELAISFDNLFIASRNYLQTISLIPRYEYAHTTTLKSIVYFKYQRKYYQQELAKDLNANHYELSYTMQKILSPRSYLQATLLGINEAKVQGNRVDVDYMEYRANVAYANQFTTRYGANASAQYRKRDYRDYSTLFGSTRDDDGVTLRAGATAEIFEEFSLGLKGTYSRVESNQNRYSYEKYTLSLGLNKTF